MVRVGEQMHRLERGGVNRVGRDPSSEIVVDDRLVSRHHGVLRLEQGTWVFEDLRSANGTYEGDRRVKKVMIEGETTLRLGHPQTGRPLTLTLLRPARPAPVPAPVPAPRPVPGPPAPRPPSGQPPGPSYPRRQDRPPGRPSGPPSVIVKLQQRTAHIGRARDNEVKMADDLLVSRHHAELRTLSGGRYAIVDLGSHNGTYVNGRRIEQPEIVGEHDIIGIGHATFHLVGGELQEFIDTGDVSLEARDLTVKTPKGQVLLDHVSFPINERCLLAVIGPSGAGKSTLLGAMTAMSPATEGSVRYDHRDLYRHYPELRHRIGLVPQEDILHTRLPTRKALRYAAELRFPGDTDAAERNRRVDEVIDELGLTAHAGTRIDALSGGQRKRVSVALELLTKPSLLFLDEPTSGLDPGLDKSVMEMMRDLAHDGRTVIVVTHSVDNLDTCDRLLVLVPGGRVAYYGPPDEGLRYFGKTRWAEVFQEFDKNPGRDWASEFKASPPHARYCVVGASGAEEKTGIPDTTPPPRQQSRHSQLGTLSRRYLSVISSDRGFIGLMLALPIILGLLARLMSGKEGLTGAPGTNAAAATTLVILSVSAAFAGGANSVRELIKERPIYRRERAAGVSSGVYLMSKLLVLGMITALQAALLVVVSILGGKLPPQGDFMPPVLEILVAVAGLGVVSMALGLLISALVDSSEKTMPLLVLIALMQVALSGGMFLLPGKVGLEQIAYLAPSRWAFGAAASTIDLGRLMPGEPHDTLWNHTAATWAMDMGALVLLGVVLLALTWWRLERLSPGRRGG
jgi:ABC-type multidrug transport system ATPase subunit/ABC-type multidrug transport system permease subunit